jgi:hypothetical protein
LVFLVLLPSLFSLDVLVVDGEWEEVGLGHAEAGLHLGPVGFGHVDDVVESLEFAVFRKFGFIGDNGLARWSLGQAQVSLGSVGLLVVVDTSKG